MAQIFSVSGSKFFRPPPSPRHHHRPKIHRYVLSTTFIRQSSLSRRRTSRVTCTCFAARIPLTSRRVFYSINCFVFLTPLSSPPPSPPLRTYRTAQRQQHVYIHRHDFCWLPRWLLGWLSDAGHCAAVLDNDNCIALLALSV